MSRIDASLRYVGNFQELPDVTTYAEGDTIIYNNNVYIKGGDKWILLSTNGDIHRSPEEQQIWKDMKGIK